MILSIRMEGIEMVDVALCFDYGYMSGALTTIASVLDKSNARFHIISTEADAEKQESMRRMLDKLFLHWNADWEIVFSTDIPEMVSWDKHLSPAASARLFIPETFPALDACLYMDCDTLALRSIDRIMMYMDMKHALFACRDYDMMRYSDTVEGYGFTWPDKKMDYFNDGVMLMNLKWIRSCGMFEEAKRLLHGNEYKYGEQDALNIIGMTSKYHDIISRDLPYKWNFVHESYALWGHEQNDGCIMHFTMPRDKPWNLDSNTDFFVRMWHNMHDIAKGVVGGIE